MARTGKHWPSNAARRSESPYWSSMRHVTVAEDGRPLTEHSLLSRNTAYDPVAAAKNAKRYRTARESVGEPDVSTLETNDGGGTGVSADDNTASVFPKESLTVGSAHARYWSSGCITSTFSSTRSPTLTVTDELSEGGTGTLDRSITDVTVLMPSADLPSSDEDDPQAKAAKASIRSTNAATRPITTSSSAVYSRKRKGSGENVASRHQVLLRQLGYRRDQIPRRSRRRRMTLILTLRNQGHATQPRT